MSMTAPHTPPAAAASDKYAIVSRLEISQILQGLARRGAIITAHLAADDFFITSIVAVDTAVGQLWLDIPPNPQQAARALGSAKLACTGSLDKVQIRFVCESVEAGTLNGRPAFLAPLPQKLARLQRREHFRIETPVAAPLKCRITATRQNRPVTVELTVLDISCGGIALLTPPGQFDPEPQAQYPCTVALPGSGTFRATLI